jgi:DNA-binding MarR family transcriptional regulator
MDSTGNAFDSGLFRHASDTHYLHLLREVLLTYRQLLRRLTAETGLSGAQFEVMREMALADGRSTVSALSRELGVDPAAVSRLVANLQEAGYLSRQSDERDRRRQPVVLTEQGRGLMVAFHEKVHECELALAAALDPASVEIATRVLNSLRDALQATSRQR